MILNKTGSEANRGSRSHLNNHFIDSEWHRLQAEIESYQGYATSTY